LKFSLRIADLETKLATLAGAVNTLQATKSCGPRGPAGPAAKIVSWRTNSFRFEAAPVMSDGTEGAPLPLKELIEILARRAVSEAKQP
jgi:hypothetical protein